MEGKERKGEKGTDVEQTVLMRERALPAAPVAVPISRWSSMIIVATVELRISFQPTNVEARKMKIEDRTTVSGVLVAMPKGEEVSLVIDTLWTVSKLTSKKNSPNRERNNNLQIRLPLPPSSTIFTKQYPKLRISILTIVAIENQLTRNLADKTEHQPTYCYAHLQT
jgi:hypothetical protein